jgi:hypothetical protein
MKYLGENKMLSKKYLYLFFYSLFFFVFFQTYSQNKNKDIDIKKDSVPLRCSLFNKAYTEYIISNAEQPELLIDAITDTNIFSNINIKNLIDNTTPTTKGARISGGKFELSFIPKKVGQYKLKVVGKDKKRGNQIGGILNFESEVVVGCPILRNSSQKPPDELVAQNDYENMDFGVTGLDGNYKLVIRKSWLSDSIEVNDCIYSIKSDELTKERINQSISIKAFFNNEPYYYVNDTSDLAPKLSFWDYTIRKAPFEVSMVIEKVNYPDPIPFSANQGSEVKTKGDIRPNPKVLVDNVDYFDKLEDAGPGIINIILRKGLKIPSNGVKAIVKIKTREMSKSFDKTITLKKRF